MLRRSFVFIAHCIILCIAPVVTECARTPFSGLASDAPDCADNFACLLPSLYFLALPTPPPVNEACGGGAILATVAATIAEGESTTIELSLTEAPSCSLGLTIRAESSSDAIVFAEPDSDRITAENFALKQTLTANAIEDLNYTSENITITLTSTSTDLAPIALSITAVDDDRVMFVSADRWNGNLKSAGGGANGIEGADNLCQGQFAVVGGLPGSAGDYKALITGGPRSACENAFCDPAHPRDRGDWVLQPNTGYFRADGTLIGETNDLALFDLPLAAPVREGLNIYWSGMSLTKDWRRDDFNCVGWEQSFGIVLVANISNASRITDKFVFDGLNNCSDRRKLLCVQQ